MSEQIKKATDKANRIFVATEDALKQDWDRKENLQFPDLFDFVIKRLGVDASTSSEVDFYIRDFVRSHPEYHVSRGAKGGIMLLSVYEARQSKKAEAAAAKKEIKDRLDAKLAASKSNPAGNSNV